MRHQTKTRLWETRMWGSGSEERKTRAGGSGEHSLSSSAVFKTPKSRLPQGEPGQVSLPLLAESIDMLHHFPKVGRGFP